MTRGSSTARVLAALALVAAAACNMEPNELAPEQAAKLDIGARRAMAEAPDSVIGVLLRTRVEPGASERAELAEAGLQVGAVVGQVVSGRARAGDLARLARLPFVVYIERAREAELHGPTGAADADRRHPAAATGAGPAAHNED